MTTQPQLTGHTRTPSTAVATLRLSACLAVLVVANAAFAAPDAVHASANSIASHTQHAHDTPAANAILREDHAD